MVSNSNNFAKEILKIQLIEISKSDDLGFSVGLIDENDFFKWSVCFTGTEDTIYEDSEIAAPPVNTEQRKARLLEFKQFFQDNDIETPSAFHDKEGLGLEKVTGRWKLIVQNNRDGIPLNIIGVFDSEKNISYYKDNDSGEIIIKTGQDLPQPSTSNVSATSFTEQNTEQHLQN